MPHAYRHFIPQNIAPPDAKSIGVYDAIGKHITSIPLGRLKPPTKAKLYSFSIVSDIYYTKYSPTGIQYKVWWHMITLNTTVIHNNYIVYWMV